MGSLDKFFREARDSTDGSIQGSKPREGFSHIQGLKGKIINQVRSLSAEAGGKGSNKKDLNSQRNFFRDMLEFLEVLLWVSTNIDINSFLFINKKKKRQLFVEK